MAGLCITCTSFSSVYLINWQLRVVWQTHVDHIPYNVHAFILKAIPLNFPARHFLLFLFQGLHSFPLCWPLLCVFWAYMFRIAPFCHEWYFLIPTGDSSLRPQVLLSKMFPLNNLPYILCTFRCPSGQQCPKMVNHRWLQRDQLHSETPVVTREEQVIELNTEKAVLSFIFHFILIPLGSPLSHHRWAQVTQ